MPCHAMPIRRIRDSADPTGVVPGDEPNNRGNGNQPKRRRRFGPGKIRNEPETGHLRTGCLGSSRNGGSSRKRKRRGGRKKNCDCDATITTAETFLIGTSTSTTFWKFGARAGMNPPFAAADDVPAEVLDNKIRVLTEQAIESGKPEAIVGKMVEGRIRKFLEEKCLVSQNYVKNGDITVQQLLDQNDAKMVGFSRLVVGEGIEKKVDDFAAEVASMTGGK
mmetsp:Transcript_26792/g.56109  ORF Transcript_26792/g.56109 Transcript_26792/m.56109 type:complete len:221 (+) Transcript_26792:33-695(+)